MSDKLEFHGEEPGELRSELPNLTHEQTQFLMANLEALRTGELRVVKKAHNKGAEFWCSECGFALYDATPNPPDLKIKFCPGCGAQIEQE